MKRHLNLILRFFLVLLFIPLLSVSADEGQTLEPIRIDNVDQLNLYASIDTRRPAMGGLMWLADSSDLIWATENEVLKLNVEDLESGITTIYEMPVRNPISSLVSSGDGNKIAAFNGEGIYIWDTSDNFQLSILELKDIEDLWLSNNGSRVVFNLRSRIDIWQSVIVIWDIENNRELNRFEYDSPVSSFVVQDAKNRIFSGHADGKIQVKDLETGENIYELDQFSEPITKIILHTSTDGTTLVAYTGWRALHIWHTNAGVAKTIELQSFLDAMVFTSDQALIALGDLGSEDISIRNTAEGIELKTLQGHTASIVALAFNADDTLLASSGIDNTLKLWAVASE
jgi:WD40 repeat protein